MHAVPLTRILVRRVPLGQFLVPSFLLPSVCLKVVKRSGRSSSRGWLRRVQNIRQNGAYFQSPIWITTINPVAMMAQEGIPIPELPRLISPSGRTGFSFDGRANLDTHAMRRIKRRVGYEPEAGRIIRVCSAKDWAGSVLGHFRCRFVCNSDYSGNALPESHRNRASTMTDTFYFAYGSNLRIDRKLERTGAIRRVRLARLKDYRFAFNKAGMNEVYANIVPCVGEVVWRQFTFAVLRR